MRPILFNILIVLFVISIFIFPISADAIENQLCGPYQKSWDLDIYLKSADLSPSGEFIVLNTGNELKTLDITGKEIKSIGNPWQECQVTTNGEYIILNNGDRIILLDHNLNEVWSYDNEYDDNKFFSTGVVEISPSGKNIVAASNIEYTGNDGATETIIYYFEKISQSPNLLWEKKIENHRELRGLSINPEGDLIGINFDSAYAYSWIIDKNGEKRLDGIRYLKLSLDGKHAVGIKENKVIYLDLSNYNIIWETTLIEEPDNVWTSLDQINNSNYVIGYSSYFNIFNDKGDIIQQYNLGKLITDVSISSDGKYLLILMNNKIAIFSNNMPLLKSPAENTIIDRQAQIFSWEDSGALKYFIKIDSNIFEISEPIFTINDSISNGPHEWSVKAIYENGEESMWTNPITFYYFNDPIPHLTFPEERQNFKEGNITFKWEYRNEVTNYLIDISGDIHESSNEELIIPSDSFDPKMYRWSVKAIRPDGSQSNWSMPRTFSISNVGTANVITNESETISQLNQKIAFIAIIFMLAVIGIFIRPNYKRFRIRQKMAKTPTDWCPHCQKFTGGSGFCPHCGEVTIKDISIIQKSGKNEK